MKRVLVACSLMFLACTPARDETFGPPIPDVPACVTQDLGVLKLPTPVDYVAVRADVPYDGPGALTPYTVLASTGQLCRHGDDRCLSTFDGVRSAGFPQAGGLIGSYVVFTHASEVGVIDTTDGLLAFLGTIDTPEEAMLLVTLTAAGPSNDGYWDCASDVQAADDGGFDVVPWTALCGDQRIAEYHVTPAGVVTQLAEQTSGGCPFSFPFF